MIETKTKLRSFTVTEIFLNEDDLPKLEKTIYGILKRSHDSQIYIEKSLYEYLLSNGYLRPHRYVHCSHYNSGSEKSVTFAGTDTTFFVIDNCDDYYQITFFRKKNFEYTHYMTRMKNIVSISFD